MSERSREPTHYPTFSERFGYSPLPNPMQLKELSPDVRRDVWNAAREFFLALRSYGFSDYVFKEDECRIVERILGRIFKMSEDEIDTGYHNVMSAVKTIILEQPFNEVLDLLELVLREEKTEAFARRTALAFETHAAAYWLDVTRPPYRFFPRSSEVQGGATKDAIQTIQTAGMEGAETHLRLAAEHINSGAYAESVKDSILAVESVARLIDPKAEKTLGPALTSLEANGVIRHRALKEAFSKLYGYTNDEQGVRHALLDKASPTVGVDEAMFMFGACASFAAYLSNKHREAPRKEHVTK